MKGEILKLLKETDGYISGQELCEKFGVSRTAVWKVINQLKEEGYEIEAVRNKGYILGIGGCALKGRAGKHDPHEMGRNAGGVLRGDRLHEQ